MFRLPKKQMESTFAAWYQPPSASSLDFILIDEEGYLWHLNEKKKKSDQIFVPFHPQLSGCVSLSTSPCRATVAALTESGEVIGWGDNRHGMLSGTTNFYEIPNQVFTLKNIKSVSCSNRYLLALDTYGVVWGCGDNAEGHLGKGNCTIYTPQIVHPTLPPITTIFAGSFAHAVDTLGKYWQWKEAEPIQYDFPFTPKTLLELVKNVNSCFMIILDTENQVWQASTIFCPRDWQRVNPFNVVQISKISGKQEQLVVIDEHGGVWMQSTKATFQLDSIAEPVCDFVPGVYKLSPDLIWASSPLIKGKSSSKKKIPLPFTLNRPDILRNDKSATNATKSARIHEG